MKLQWEQGDAWHLRTKCQRFTISKAKVGNDLVYTAWRRRPTVLLGTAHVVAVTDPWARTSAIDGLKELCEGFITAEGEA